MSDRYSTGIFKSLCTRLANYILDEKIRLLSGYTLLTGDSASPVDIDYLEAVAHHGVTPFHRSEACHLLGRYFFSQRSYTQSLGWFKAASDQNPHNGELWSMVAWNCLVLGLVRDAKEAQRQYAVYLSRSKNDPSTNPHVQLSACGHLSCQVSQLTALNYGIPTWESNGWLTKNLSTSVVDYDYKIARFLYHCLCEDGVRPSMLALYRKWGNEWVSSALMACLAFYEHDLALCSEYFEKAMTRASSHHHPFLETLSQQGLTGLSSVCGTPSYNHC